MSEYFDGLSGPSTNYAQFETRIAYLSTPGCFALSLCERYLGLTGEMVEAAVGRYVRGKRKGLLRGFVEYVICIHGGWVRGRGFCGRGLCSAALCIQDGWDGRHRCLLSSVIAEWSRKDTNNLRKEDNES